MYIAEKDFKPMKKKPESGNPYWNRKPTGYSPCIIGKPTCKGLDVLSNCVGWVVGRMNQETNMGKCIFYGNMNACSIYSNAKKNGLPTGTIPKIGATACWSGGSDKRGHVAQVEEVYSDDYFLSSESAYNSYTFKNVKRKKGKNNNWGMSDKYKFQGFVYNPNIIKVAEPVDRDEDTNQLKILKNKLRIRTEPSLNGTVLDFAVKDGIYNDLETREADGYVWHKIAEMNWLAEVDGYVELLPKVEFHIGDKVTVKEQPEYYIIDFIDGSNVNITMTTTIDNLNKYEGK